MKINDEIILVGGGGHCKACIDIIETENRYRISGVIDIPERVGKTVLGYPIFADDAYLDEIDISEKLFLITVGFIDSPELRIKLFQKIKNKKGFFPVIVSPTAHLSKHSEVLEGTIIMHGAVINAGTKIGQNCIINNLALVEHDVSIGNQCHISTGVRVNGECRIEDNCFLGSGVVLNQGVKIGSDIVIGSGSVVRKNIFEHGIYVGDPLKKIK